MCRHTEDSHVKTKLIHTLCQIQRFGEMPLKEFKDLLTEADYLKCQQNTIKKWYPLILEIFTSFIYRISFWVSLVMNVVWSWFFFSISLLLKVGLLQHEIAEAAEAEARAYQECTPVEEITDHGIVTTMKKGAKEKTNGLYYKMRKIVIVACPDLGSEWLIEIISNFNSKSYEHSFNCFI